MAKARTQARVCLIGLDSVPPALLFHKFWPHLPNLRRLVRQGGGAVLQSCDPPITVPAWAAMLTGHDPGTLGLYGFHDRADPGYEARRLASSHAFTRPPLWEILSAAGLRSHVLGVPHTYPVRPFSGTMVTGMLTPPDIGVAVHPPADAPAVRAHLGVHALDVDDFRHAPLAELVAHARAASAGLFALARARVRDDADWSLTLLVDTGPDRLQHALWRHAFADHPLHVPGHPLQHALLDYYVHLDTLVGGLVAVLHPDDLVMVVSDHGACAMHGSVALNQWLLEQGHLVLHRQPDAPGPLRPRDVDWERTRAWADGGYVGRIYVNQAGREPRGIVPAAACDAFLDTLCRQLCETLPTPPLPHRFVRPASAYREVNGCPPDLLVYLAGLRWRALGSYGATVMARDNDRGPDGANHDADGIIVMRGPRGRGLAARHSLYDVAPTVLAHLQLPMPATLRGSPVMGAGGAGSTDTSAEIGALL